MDNVKSSSDGEAIILNMSYLHQCISKCFNIALIFEYLISVMILMNKQLSVDSSRSVPLKTGKNSKYLQIPAIDSSLRNKGAESGLQDFNCKCIKFC